MDVVLCGVESFVSYDLPYDFYVLDLLEFACYVVMSYVV